LCRKAVARYTQKWSRREKVDVRVLNEWECKVNECVQKKIASLKRKHINRRKRHILRSRRHLQSLEELHSKYVLVPADKAAQNVIVVCKKYYWEVVLKEIDLTATYESVMQDCQSIVDRHTTFFLQNTVLRYHLNACLCFIGCKSFINNLMVLGS